jgi:O-antigen/teichoic acid export membrane protein
VGHDRALVDSIRLLLIGLLALAATAGGAAYGVMDLYGPGFSAGANALAILLLAQALAAIPACCAMCLWAANRPAAVSVASGIACLVGVSACVVFSLKLGVTGPAVGVLAGQVVYASLLLGAVRRELSLPLSRLLPWHELAPLALAYGTAFAGARVVDAVLPSIAGLLAAMTLGLVIFGLVLVLTGGLSSRERARLAQLSAVLPARIRRLSAVRASVAKAAQGQG